MPLHFNSFFNGSVGSALLAYVFEQVLDKCTEGFGTPDRRHFHTRAAMVDSITGEPIGKLVCSMWANLEEQRNEIQDLDTTLDNPAPSRLSFLKKLDQSSDSTEYYEVETADTEQHLHVETVNRHIVPGELTGTTRDAFISVFPFELNMFDSIDAFNRWAGFKEPHRIGPTDMYTSGFSDTFIAPGGLLSSSSTDDDAYSFLIGTVIVCRDVRVEMGERVVKFVLAQVQTALGVVPVAMGREVFNIEGICAGKVLAMNAHVKADLATAEDFVSG